MSVVESVLTVTAPSRLSSTTRLETGALTDCTGPSISSPACPRGVTTAVEPTIEIVMVTMDPAGTVIFTLSLKSSRLSSSSTSPEATPVSVKFPEASVTADCPVETTVTVTPERPVSIPCAAAPEAEAPRMTVPVTVALPAGDVGDEEDSLQAAAKSRARAQNVNETARGIDDRDDMGSSV